MVAGMATLLKPRSKTAAGSVLALALTLVGLGIRAYLRTGAEGAPRGQPSAAPPAGGQVRAAPATAEADCAGALRRLVEDRASGVEVECAGRVKKVLPDDDETPRHQRLILTLTSGRTLLIAHNIDLAPRVPAEEGDEVSFRGEFEYSENGGVVHWTHRDPARRHESGWIRHRGRTYQ